MENYSEQLNQNEKIINITKDGLKKIILEQGYGDIPKNNQICDIIFIAKLSNGKEFQKHLDEKYPYQFALNQKQVVNAIFINRDLAVSTMKKGEKIQLFVPPQYGYGDVGNPPLVPENAHLEYEIKLLNFKDREKTKWDFTIQERLAIALKLKDEGNEFFKQQNYEESIQKYRDSFDYVFEDNGEEQNNLKIICNNNLGMCFQKQQMYKKAIWHYSQVLKTHPTNIKALFRRGQLYMLKDKFDEAQEDLKKVKELDVQNKEIDFELVKLQQKIKQSKMKDKQIYSKLFAKENLDYYNELDLVDEYSDKNNPLVFLDIQIGNSNIERIQIELFKNHVPKTADNFRQLCTGENKDKICFKNTVFHRLIKKFMVQGGDVENLGGKGGKSIYGKNFDDENFVIKHKKRGYLSMANSGKNTNNSQFFIIFQETPWLDGLHVVFGRIIKNLNILNKIEQVQTTAGDIPQQKIIIINCGEIKENNYKI